MATDSALEDLLELLSAPPDALPVDRPCVGSGFCCKKVPCPYGSRDPSTSWCIHLIPWEGDDLGVPRYRCGRYEYIVKQPGAEWIPAFGAGCCAPLFNEDRSRIVKAIRLRRGPDDPIIR
jgi:hypothetical protein